MSWSGGCEIWRDLELVRKGNENESADWGYSKAEGEIDGVITLICGMKYALQLAYRPSVRGIYAGRLQKDSSSRQFVFPWSSKWSRCK